jgi:hypothetical protein
MKSGCSDGKPFSHLDFELYLVFELCNLALLRVLSLI